MPNHMDPPIRHLATTLLACLALFGCNPEHDEASVGDRHVPVADVEGSAVPGVAPVAVVAPAEELDWTVDGQDRLAVNPDDAREGQQAALRYMDSEADADATGSVGVERDAARDPGARTVPGAADGNARVASEGASDAVLADPDEDARRIVGTRGASAPTPAPEQAPPFARREVSTARPAVAGDPRQARSLNREAIGLINSGRPRAAIALLERALAMQPRDPEILGNLGYAYMLAGEHANARARLEAALDISPTRSATWLNLGQAYAELGRRDAAVAAVLKGYRNSTRKPSVRSALQRAATGERHSAAWREVAGTVLSRLGS